MIRWDPEPDADPASGVYTFGGAAPVATWRPGQVLSTWTRDCFGGRVRFKGQLRKFSNEEVQR